VKVSQSDCTLERGADGQPAVRLALRMVKGLSQAAQERIDAARSRPYESADDLARRADLDCRDMNAPAAAGALASVSGHQRLARWDVTGIEVPVGLLREARIIEAAPDLLAPTEGQDLVAGY
jgi:error-prone DNA polymerase